MGSCLFDDKIYLFVDGVKIEFSYKIDDYSNFMNFYSVTKKFMGGTGFGSSRKDPDKNWFKKREWKWKEMDKEDENQST